LRNSQYWLFLNSLRSATSLGKLQISLLNETSGKGAFMTTTLRLIMIILTLSLVLSACGTVAPTPITEYIVVTATMPPLTTTMPPAAITITGTADLCAPENIQTAVQGVHKFTREFDDASTLAASRPREQLADSIANLQRIRRDAEDQVTPTCLATLKTYQVSHMNSVINTLVAFMGGADQESVDQGISLARQQHDRYTIELARVLGVTMVPADPEPAPTLTPTP
jgi:hypothetical protein